jgi:hypothetical protein
MKKIFTLIILCCLILTLTSCNVSLDELNLNKFEEIIKNDVPIYYLAVPNAQETLDFDKFIPALSSLKVTIYKENTDGTRINVDGVCQLDEGDNIFVISIPRWWMKPIEYKFLVHRNEMYNVTFAEINYTVQVEEGHTVEKPTNKPRLKGMLFVGWDWDFSQPITENTTITALWERNIKTESE